MQRSIGSPVFADAFASSRMIGPSSLWSAAASTQPARCRLSKTRLRSSISTTKGLQHNSAVPNLLADGGEIKLWGVGDKRRLQGKAETMGGQKGGNYLAEGFPFDLSAGPCVRTPVE